MEKASSLLCPVLSLTWKRVNYSFVSALACGYWENLWVHMAKYWLVQQLVCGKTALCMTAVICFLVLFCYRCVSSARVFSLISQSMLGLDVHIIVL